jgi:excinuclease UvrABC nuclease subunit
MEFTINGDELSSSVLIRDNSNVAPERPGVYGFFLCNECVYVGQAKNLNRRLRRHLNRFIDSDIIKHRPTNNKYKILKPYIKYLSWSIIEYVDDFSNLTKTENKWIDYYNPIFNIRTPNGKRMFSGTSDDIEDFIYGLATMDMLRQDYL